MPTPIHSNFVKTMTDYSNKWNIDFGYVDSGRFFYVKDNVTYYFQVSDDIIIKKIKKDAIIVSTLCNEDVSVYIEYDLYKFLDIEPSKILEDIKIARNHKLIDVNREIKLRKFSLLKFFEEVKRNGYTFKFVFGNTYACILGENPEDCIYIHITYDTKEHIIGIFESSQEKIISGNIDTDLNKIVKEFCDFVKYYWVIDA